MQRIRNPSQAFIHDIEWDKDISYYVDYIVEQGFEEIEAIDSMSMNISENTSLSFLFTAFIDDPIRNANFSIFYDVLMHIMKKRKQRDEGIQRGDMIHINFLCEGPQDGWLFWDGDNIIRGSEIGNEEYGIPEEFHIFEEFPPNYWKMFPFMKPGGEMVKISSMLLRYADNVTGLSRHCVFVIWFGSEKYILVLEKNLAEKIRDNSDHEVVLSKNIEIDNSVMDFLLTQGLDSSTVYDRAVACNEVDEDELTNMMDELQF